MYMISRRYAKKDEKKKKSKKARVRAVHVLVVFYYTRILHAAAPIVPAQMT